MGRQPCCEKIGLKRGPWTTEEDHKLTNFILHNGIHCWRAVPKLAGLLRCGKSCRLRWINYLRPDLKRGALSEWEENQIIQLHKRLGNKWSKIAAHFPGRTDNEIKNHWNTGIKKRLKDLGLDPVTHLPINQRCETEERMIETAQNPNASGQQYDSSKAESIDSHAMQQQEFPLSTEGSKEEKQISDVDQLLLLEGSSDLLDNCDEKLGGIDLTMWLNQPSPSPSFSAGDFLNPAVGESSSISIMEDPFQQWVDNVDSWLSWDGFNLLQDELFFLDQIKTQKLQ